MSDDPQLDEPLQRHFGALRADDMRRAPAFGPMLEAARREVAARNVDGASGASAPVAAMSRTREVPRDRQRLRLLAVAVPTLVAAGLLLMLGTGESGADREFEALVTEWSRTASGVRSSPTDVLLSLPGDEYLRGMPTIGGDQSPSRSRSSS